MKKLISICISVMCLLLSLCCVFAEEGLSDKQLEAVSFMNDIGIYDGINEEKAADTVTRAEFARIIVKVMGGENSLSQSPRRIFADVLTDNSAAASIEYLYDRGVMGGYGQAEFKPDSVISLAEAVKVMVSITGYSDMAQMQGGYPNGYYSMAASNGILDGISDDAGDQITYANAAVIIGNVLESDNYRVITGYKNNNLIFENNNGEEYMSYVLNLHRFAGILEAYGNTSLAGVSNEYDANTVKIGGEVFEFDSIDVSQYLGMNVKVYYKADKKGYHVMHILPDRNTKALEVQSGDIDERSALTKFQYYENSKLKDVKIAENAIFIYNGKRLDVVSDADIRTNNGYVRLVSNNNGKTYDVVIIKEYDTFIVDKAVATDSVVNFKYGRGSMDLSVDANVLATFYLEGQEVDFASISSGSVLSIAISKNTSGYVLAEVLISNNQVTGTAKRIFNKGTQRYVELADESEYAFTNEYLSRLKEGISGTYEPSVTDEGTFYIDYFNALAGYELSVGSKNYAFVVNCWYEEGPGQGEIRLFTKEGNFENYALASKITYNDKKVDKSQVPDMLKKSGYNGTVNQLIIASTTSDGYIKKIQTAEDKTSETYYISSDNEFILNAHPKNANGEAGIRFYKDMAEHYPFSYVSGKTIQFMIPYEKPTGATEYKLSSNEKEYKISTKLATTDIGLPAPLYLYDAGNGGALGAVVSNTKKTDKFGTPSVVDEIERAINEDEEEGILIKFVGGQSVFAGDDIIYVQPGYGWSDYADYSNVKVEDLKRGDVIAYTTTNNEVDSIEVIVRADDVGLPRTDGVCIAESGNMIADVISVADNGRTAVVYYYDNEKKAYYYQTMLVNSTTYRYDSSDGEVYNSSSSDLQPGDRILINSFWWSPRLIVIFR